MNYTIKIAETCRNVMTLAVGVLLVSCGGGGGSSSGGGVGSGGSLARALNSAQDGMVGRDVTANNPADGKLGFSFTNVTGGCVQDNVTGLMWEVKTIDGGSRDWATPYPYATASGVAATANTAPGLCNHTDWRLPTPDELQGLVDYSVAAPGPTIDTTWIPNTKGSVFWSVSSYLPDSTKAWGVDFSTGFVGPYPNTEAHYVRVVRGTGTGLNDTGVTANQCFQTGSNSLVAC
jgi:hypothetical protein